MKLTIRWSLIIGFLCLIWGTYVVTTTSTFVSSQKTLNGHAMNIMENIADLAMEKSQNHLAHAHGAAMLTRRLLTANVVSVNDNNIDSLEQYFLDQLVIYPHFAGIYLGKPNGDFFYVKPQRAAFTRWIPHENNIPPGRRPGNSADLARPKPEYSLPRNLIRKTVLIRAYVRGIKKPLHKQRSSGRIRISFLRPKSRELPLPAPPMMNPVF